jgi:hypothetical protein
MWDDEAWPEIIVRQINHRNKNKNARLGIALEGASDRDSGFLPPVAEFQREADFFRRCNHGKSFGSDQMPVTLAAGPHRIAYHSS